MLLKFSKVRKQAEFFAASGWRLAWKDGATVWLLAVQKIGNPGGGGAESQEPYCRQLWIVKSCCFLRRNKHQYRMEICESPWCSSLGTFAYFQKKVKVERVDSLLILHFDAKSLWKSGAFASRIRTCNSLTLSSSWCSHTGLYEYDYHTPVENGNCWQTAWCGPLRKNPVCTLVLSLWKTGTLLSSR